MHQEHTISIFGRKVYPSSNCIHYRGKDTRVEPRVMRVLILLYQNRGRLVSKQELLDHAWGGIVVTDDSVTKVISEIRKLFGPDGDRLIETIWGMGYRMKPVRKRALHLTISTYVLLAIIAALLYILLGSGLVQWAIDLATHIST